jgi:O-antigen/teichoic acid export membrane protein
VIQHLRHIAIHVAIYGAGQASGRILQLLALPFLTRDLTPELYGALAVLAIFAIAARSLFGLGLGSAIGIVYFRSADDVHRRATIWSGMILAAGLAMLLVLAVTAARREISAVLFGDAVLGHLVVLQAATAGIQMATEPMLLNLQYGHRPLRFVAVSQAGGFLGLALGVVLVVEGFGAAGWLAGNLAGAAVSLALAVRLARPQGPPKPSPAIGRALIISGLPLIPGTLLVFILLNGAPFLVGSLAGLGEAGIFGAGYQLGLGMGLFTGAFSAAWYPFFQSFARRQGEASALFPRLITAYLLVFGGLLALVFAFARPAVLLLTEPRFHAAWQVVGLVAASQYLFALWGALLPGVYYSGETRTITVFQAAGALFAVLLHVAMIPSLAGAGAGFAMVAAAGAMVVAQAVFNRWRGYTVKVLEPRRAPAVLTLTAFVALALQASAGALPLTAHFAVSAVALTSYVLLGWALIEPRERNALLRILASIVPRQ